MTQREIKYFHHQSGVDFSSLFQIYSFGIVYWISIIAVNVFSLCAAAVLGNVAVLMTIWKTPSLHSPANMLLASLAVSDLGVGFVSQPLFIVFFFSTTQTVTLANFMSSSLFCTATIVTLTAIVLDRFLAIHMHLRYQSLVTVFRVSLVVLFNWLCSVFLSGTWLWKPNLFFLSVPPTIWTLIVVNFVVYLKIFLVVRRHQAQIRDQLRWVNSTDLTSFESLKKSAVNTLLVFVLLVCCYLPYSLHL